MRAPKFLLIVPVLLCSGTALAQSANVDKDKAADKENEIAILELGPAVGHGIRSGRTQFESWRLASRLHDPREAIRRPGLLQAREARILRLRYVDGFELDDIAKRVGYSVPVVRRSLRAGVRKLRAFFQSKGLETLPLDSPIPNGGNQDGCPAEVRS